MKILFLTLARIDSVEQKGIYQDLIRKIRDEGNEIIKMIELLLNNQAEYDKMAKAVNPYGDGHASKIIYEKIKMES